MSNPLCSRSFYLVALFSALMTTTALAQREAALTTAGDGMAPFVHASATSYLAVTPVATTTPDTSDLPDAPSSILAASSSTGTQDRREVLYQHGPVAPRLEMYIKPGFVAQPLNAKQKVELGLRDLYRPGSLVGIVASASYSQLINGAPNYGSNAVAYGQRLGATAIRDSSGAIFTAAVFAPLLHEDPRYYVEGPQHNVIQRTLYAITRPLITRTDAGNSTINGALLAGNAAASLLTVAYYPQANRNVHDVASIYGTSIGGSALGFFVDEFIDGVLKSVHLQKR